LIFIFKNIAPFITGSFQKMKGRIRYGKLLLLLGLLVFLNFSEVFSQTRVQYTTGNTGSGARTTITMTALSTAPVNGNTLIAIISTRGTSANRVSSILQTGVTWSFVTQAANTSGTTTEIWYAPNVSGAGTAITINLASLRAAAVIVEYSGILQVSPQDQVANNTGSVTPASTGTTATTTQANELWIGGIGLVSSGYTLGTATNAFTTITNAASTNTTATSNAKVYALERIATTTGTASTGGTISTSSQWSGAIATFKKALPVITNFSPINSCSGSGATITITGTNLDGATSVSFNGISASFTVISSTQVTAILPAGATSGNITLINPVGTATSSSSFTVSLNLSAVSITPSASQTLCTGSSGSTLTVAETGGGTITSRQWGYRTVSGGAITSISGATSNTYTPTSTDLGTGTKYLVCTSTPTCGSALVSNEVTETINPLPSGSLSNNGPICVGGSANIVFTASSGTGPYNIVISGTTYNNIISGNIVTTVSPSTTTVYTLTSVTDLGVTPNCSNTVSSASTVSVITPVATITGTNYFCSGESTTLSAETSSAGSGSITDYQWNLNGSAIAGATSFTYSVNTTGNYTVTIKNSLGCTATSAVTTVTNMSTVTPTLTGSATACAGGTIGVGYYTETGKTNYVWTISSGGTNVGKGTSTDYRDSIIWNSVGTETISVSYTSGGCLSTTVSKTITVNPRPTPTISTSATNVCTGSSTNLYTTESGMSNYVWSITASSGTISGSSTNAATVTWSVAGAVVVRVNYSDANNCRAAAATAQNVTVNPLPVPLVIGPSTVCAGTTGNVYSVEPAMSNYSWTVSSGGSITSGGGANDNSVTITWNTAGAQYVIVNYTNEFGCTREVATRYDVQVNPLPSPVIIGPSSLCNVPSTGNIYTTESGMASYVWSVSSGGTINTGAGTNAVNVTWSTSGTKTISVSYINGYGCSIANPIVNTVNVHIPVTPTLSGAATVCSGSTGNVYTTEGGMTGYTWSVSPGGMITAGGSSSDPTNTVSWIASGSQSVSIGYMDTNGCTTNKTTYAVAVTEQSSATIDYAGSPFCSYESNAQTAILIGTGNYLGGTFSAPAGLSINASTGAITPSTSTPGTYMVTYSKPAIGGCNILNANTTVTINAPATASVYYAGTPYCTDPGVINVTRIGAAGGTYSASPSTGLSLNTSTGAVNYAASTAGDYQVTYTIAAGGGCGTFLATANISINKQSPATFSYTGTPYCQSGTNPLSTFSGGGVAGTFTSIPAGLSLNSATGLVNLSASTPGIYTVVNTISGVGQCPQVVATSPIEIHEVPNATISYSPNVRCSDAGIVNITRTGTTGGIFTASPAGLSIDSETGAINTGASTQGTYNITYTINSACGTYTRTTSFTVNTAPLAITGNDGGVCPGASVQLGSTSITGHTYSWTSNPAGFTSTLANPIVTPTVTTTYYLTEVISSNSCTRNNTVTITPNASLSVTATPSTQVICSGNETNIQISSSITNAALTWTAALVSGSSTSGFSAGSGRFIAQTLTNTSGSASIVRYTILGSASGCTNAGIIVDITVNPSPGVITISGGPITFCSGGNVTLTSSATSGNQWFVDGTLITGAVNRTLTTSTGGNYSVIVTNAFGCSVTSTSTLITVNPTPVVENNGGTSLCVGSSITLLPSSGGVWTSSLPSVATVTNAGIVTGVSPGNATFTYSNGTCSATTNVVTVYSQPTVSLTASPICVNSTTTLTPTTGGTWVSSNPVVAYVSNLGTVTGISAGNAHFTYIQASTGCSGTTSDLQVNDLPAVSILGPATICVNNTTTLYPASGGTWVSSNPAIATVTNGGIVTGISGGMVTFTFTTPLGCSNTTDPVTVHANPPVNIVGSQSVCVNSTTILSPSTGGTWVSSYPSIASVTNDGIVTGLISGSATFTFTMTSTGCNSTTLPINVNALPTVNVTGSSSICGNGTTTLSPTTGGIWTSNNTSIATVTNGGIVSGVSPGNPIFTFTQSITGCSNKISNITITTGPSISAMTSSICSGSAFNITPVNGTNGTVPVGITYTWSTPTVQSGITGGASGSNATSITGTLANSTTNPLTAIYSVTPTSGGCIGSPFTLTVTVNPAPPSYNISFYQLENDDDLTFCGGQIVYSTNDIDILLPPNDAQPSTTYFNGSTVLYEYATAPTGPWLPASGALSTHYQFVMPNPPSVYSIEGNHYFRLKITNSSGCYSYSDVVNMTITSGLTTDAGLDVNICQSSSPTPITLSGASVTGVSTTTLGGSWKIVSGSGSLSSTSFQINPASVIFTVPANYTGTVVLLLTTNDPDGNGSCTPVTDTRIINVGTSTVTPGSQITVCSSASPSPVLLSGASVPNGSAAAWSITSPVGVGTLSNTGQTATPATVTYTPQAGYSGTVTLTLTGLGGCPGSVGSRNIVINSTPSSAITGSNSVCPGSTTNYAGPLGMATYTWNVTSGTASILSTSAQNTNVVVPSSCSNYTLGLTTTLNGCGSTTTLPISYTDIQAPVLSACPVVPVLNANSGNTYVKSDTTWDVNASDNCTYTKAYTLSGATTGSGTSLKQVAFNVGTTTVTWRATDLCGNQTSCSFPVQVSPNLYSDLTVTELASPSQIDAGAELIYTITVKNIGAEIATGVVIKDTVTSSLTSPQYSTSLSGTWYAWPVSETYNFPGTIAPGGTFTIYIKGYAKCSAASLSNTVNVSAGNDINTSNNSASVSVQVFDQTLPVFTFCPTLKAVCNNSGSTYVHSGTAWDAIATDNCTIASLTYILSGATTGTGSSLSGRAFNEGETFVTWRAIDNAGNIAECGFSVRVIVNDQCLITGPANVCPNSVNIYTAPVSIYDYNHYTYSWSITSGTATIVGSSTSDSVQVMAPSTCSSYTLSLSIPQMCVSKTCSLTAIAVDTEKPTATPPDTITIMGSSGTFPNPDPTIISDATDNCGVPTVTWVSDGAATTSGCTQTIVRTYRVIDVCGNYTNLLQYLIRKSQGVTPTFNAVSPICSGATMSSLPTTSLEGITGTWSPALNNTATTTYTFTPTVGLCANTATMTIVVNPNITPTFNSMAPICSGASLSALPTTSTNGITGTWSPALNNTATTIYTFTPTTGQCATTTTLTITVNPNITPTFNSVAPICSGATVTALPTTSTNSITGTWLPAMDNTATTTYTFTPTTGQCATTTTLTITVNPNITPTFNAVASICSGASLAALPTTSTNSITGTWSPALNNTATTTYTFTPTAGLCATTTTMTITVNQLPAIYSISGGGTICSGGTGADISISNTQTGVNYQLYNGGIATGSPLAGTGSLASFGYQTAAGTYTAIASNATTGCSQNMSGSVTIILNTVNPGSIAKGDINPGPACEPLDPNAAGSNIDATGSGTITYFWVQSTDGGTTWQSAAGSSTTSYRTFNPDPMSVTTRLRRVAISSYNGVDCQARSNELEYVVYPLPTVESIKPGAPLTISFCVNSTYTLTNATSGGVWSTSDPAIATVSGGIVTGVGGGPASISYTVTDIHGCSKTANRTVTVIALPGLSYTTSICVGSTMNLTPSTGGTWVSSDPSKATISGSGLVTGIAPGTVTFTFTDSTTGCSAITSIITVYALPANAPIYHR
jgi:hypothetical protein